LNSIDIAIMTPLVEEWEEMVKHLNLAVDEPFLAPTKRGRIGSYSVLCVDAGKGQEEMAASLTRTLERAKPSIVLLVGIAGGFPAMGVHRGDVVVIHTVHSFDYGKLVDGKFIRRPELDYNCDPRLLEFANLIARSANSDWQRSIRLPRPDSRGCEISRAHTDCYLASSNQVVDDDKHIFYSTVAEKFPEIHAVDTEAVGAGASVRWAQAERQVSLLVIRGVSDEPGMAVEGGSSSRKEWRRYASATAAAFTRKLIESLPRRREWKWKSAILFALTAMILTLAGVLVMTQFKGRTCISVQSNPPFVLGGLIALAGEKPHRDLSENCECTMSHLSLSPGSPSKFVLYYEAIQKEDDRGQRIALKQDLVDQLAQSLQPANSAQLRLGYGSVGVLETLLAWDRLQEQGARPDKMAAIYLLDMFTGLRDSQLSGPASELLRGIRASQFESAEGRIRAAGALRSAVRDMVPDSNLPELVDW
jgi:nucleoside phosphorylase